MCSICCIDKYCSSYNDTAQTAVDRGSAAYATPPISDDPGAYDAPILMAGYADDWDCRDAAYPVSASDADGPFIGVGVLVGD